MPLESVERLHLRHLARLLLLAAAGVTAFIPTFLARYIESVGGHKLMAPAPVLHVVVIMGAIGFSAFATYVAYRAYRATGKPFLKWLLLGMLAFTVIYSPHGFLTTVALDAGNPWVFLLYGPASRLVLAACFFTAAFFYAKPAAVADAATVKRTIFLWVAVFLVICLVVLALALSPIAGERNLRWSMEFLAIGLLVAGSVVLWYRGARSSFVTIFLIVQLFFIQSSIAFLTAPMWSHSWWFAHVIFAGGFLLLTFQVATVYLGGVSFEDVFSSTEMLKRLETANERYERSNRELSQFAHTVSHDLQAPLRRMVSFLDLADEGLQGAPVSDDVRDYLGQVRGNAQQLRELVSRILELSSVSTKSLNYSEVDLGVLVRDVLDLFSDDLREIGADCEIENSLPVVIADRVLLFQVFQNLVQNAIKYREPERSLRIGIRARRDESGYVVDVADNGRGFSMKHAQKAFQMLSRLHSTKVSGTGAGLAICARIMGRHGGRMTVDAEVDRGATFHVHLPAQPLGLVEDTQD